jgi:hypothetical protein
MASPRRGSQAMASSPQGLAESRGPLGRAAKSCSKPRRRPPWTRGHNSPCHMAPPREGNNLACPEKPTYRRNQTCPSFRSASENAPQCPPSVASLPRRRQLQLIWSDRCPWLNFECPNIRRGTPEGQVPNSEAGRTNSQRSFVLWKRYPWHVHTLDFGPPWVVGPESPQICGPA